MFDIQSVKPVLTTTLEEWPPAYHEHYLMDLPTECSAYFTCGQQLPVYNDHFLCLPWVVVVDRFDCISYQVWGKK